MSRATERMSGMVVHAPGSGLQPPQVHALRRSRWIGIVVPGGNRETDGPLIVVGIVMMNSA
jgi:hypothetical protein